MAAAMKRAPALPAGPLAPFAEGFLAQLAANGYVSSGLRGQRGLFNHLDRWMDATGLEVADLNPAVLGQFLQTRADAGYATKLTAHALAPLLDYLRRLDLHTEPAPSITPADEIRHRFHRHLREERGLGADTAANYERVAQRFLATLAEPFELSLAGLSAQEVTAFVLARSPELSVSAMQTVVGGLRALLGFLFAAGLTRQALALAVPSVARRPEGLPRALPPDHVEALLTGCDRSTPVGIRDFAILVVLARLGLRANEVASLRLEDIDWRSGELVIRGKGPRLDKLPLPTDVGEALVDYLEHARPNCADRRVFIRSSAPRQGLTRQAIGGLVRAASVRAGLAAHGPHRLRHTVATNLLAEGAPLVEIAQLLRQRTHQTTVLYAKVVRRALAALAQPWPGSTQ
jgi:integrase/recombinase XerD